MKKLSRAAIGLILVALPLAGCATEEVHLSERGRNIALCQDMVVLHEQMYEDFDKGAVSDPTAYMNDVLDRWEQMGERADSPMGDWLIENAAGARAAMAAGDTAETEADGEALNNGEAVEADEGSLHDRCERLGVTIP